MPGHHEIQSLCDLGLQQKPQTLLSGPLAYAQEDHVCQLSKQLQQKDNVCSMPVHKDDEVQVVQGHYNDHQAGMVVQV